MIYLTLYNSLWIKVDADDTKVLDLIRNSFSFYVENYWFMPKYKAGVWDGKLHIFDYKKRLLPYGLLFDLIKILKKRKYEVKASDEVKSLYGSNIDLDNIQYDLNLTPRYYQSDTIKECLKYKKGCFLSPTACHTIGDRVLMSNGILKNIENIKIGDKVIGKDGKPKKVLNLHRGIDNIYEVNPRNNRKPIKVTENHLLHIVFTNQGYGKRGPQNGDTDNISVEEYLNKSKWYKHISYLLYNNKEIELEDKDKIDCNLSPYFIGMYLGDGNASNCGITTMDEECIKSIYEESSKFEMKIREHGICEYYIRGKIGKRNKIFYEFDKIGLKFGSNKNRIKCHERYIPNSLLSKSIEFRKELLAGLIDSDGSLSSTYYGFSTKSKRMTESIESLIISLGLVCSIKERIINEIPYYRVNIMGDIKKIPVRIQRKKTTNTTKKNSYRTSFDINYIGKENFYGIEVEDSLYITNCGMITHNSGKSYSISCLIKILIDSNKIKNSLIIVPTTGLILQFYEDMIDYGMDESLLGEFYAEKKDWNKPILISTWQSLTHNNEKLRKSEVNTLKKELKKKNISKEEKTKLQERYTTITSKEYIHRVKEFMEYKQTLLNEVDCVIVDEAQGAKSTELLNLMQKIKNAEWRFGCTGTMPQSKIDMANIKSYIGPVIKRYTVKELTDAGYLNPCSIHVCNLYYKKKFTGKLDEVKDQVFENKFRKQFIRDKIYNAGDENFLILVGRIEKEGMILEDYLKEQFPEKQIKFIHGKIKAKDREYWRQKCINEKNIILIAVYQLFQQGINIPNLSYVMFGSSYKAKIRTLQSIGRSLRKSEGKKTSHIIDIVDHSNKYLPKHAKERMKYYVMEEFDINEMDLHEN